MNKFDYKQFYRGKKVLITGGLGFIGSNLAIELVKLNAEVLLIDSLIPQYGGNLFNITEIKDKVKVNITDVRDEYSMDYLVQGQDIVFNLAGTLSHIDSMKDPFTDLEINCRSQLSILESCKKYNPEIKIIFAGTRGQYGHPEYLPVDEKHSQKPIDVNGINNMAGEWYHILYNNAYGIRACSLRLTNTFGPRHQMKHPRQGVINWFIRQCIDNEKIRIYGDGKQIRDVNYVGDVVEAFLLVAATEKSNGEIYNLGGTHKNLKEIVDLIIKIAGTGEYELIPYPSESKKIEIGDYIADYSKIKDSLGWTPDTSFDDGVRKTVEFYRKYSQNYWKKGKVL